MLIASLGIAIGAIWEVAERGFDRIPPGNVIKGKNDTVTDISWTWPGPAGGVREPRRSCDRRKEPGSGEALR